MTEFDVIVIGSGAAGMTAALTAAHRGLRPVIVEKAERFGGSTARSGGALWIPDNEALRAAGVADSPEWARAYLHHLLGDTVPTDRQRAFLDHGPAMLTFVREHTPLNFVWVPGYSDYYPEAPGGLPQGRTVEPVPVDGNVLGEDLAALNPSYLPTPRGIAITSADYRWLVLGLGHPRSLRAAARVAGRWTLSRVLGRLPLSLGQALAAGLRAGLRQAGVPVWLNTSMTELHVTDGRVTGVVLRRDGRETLLRARLGVILASGGFEHDAVMRRKYQRAPISTAWTVGAASNTGDGIRAAESLGAALDLMDDAWWGPSLPLPGGPYFCLAERSLPGSVLVNADGERFVNEAAPYVDAVHAMYDDGRFPYWLVFDERFRGRYMFAGRSPWQGFPRRWYEAGVAFRAGTPAELAGEIGTPGLAGALERFNTLAQAGRDTDFRRGQSAYDLYYGDPRNRPNPCLAPLAKPPFHAVRVVPGDLGTKGGLRTDARARVIHEDGSAIPGLYAAGNVSAAVMGRTYAGAGATLGPAMTFGYIAALDLAAATKE